MKKTLSISSLVLALLVSVSSNSYAQLSQAMPTCFGFGGITLQASNEQVIQMKTTVPNGQKRQVFVKTRFVKAMADTNNNYGIHMHFIVSLRDTVEPAALIEISLSRNDYTSPTVADLSAGPVYICGEYSTTDKNGYPPITKFEPSDTGAMIHWTHFAKPNGGPTASGHPSGWIYANGKLFGTYLSGSSGGNSNFRPRH